MTRYSKAHVIYSFWSHPIDIKNTTNIKKVAHKKGHKALTHAKRVAGQLLCYPSIPFLTKTCMIYFKNLGGISHNF